MIPTYLVRRSRRRWGAWFEIFPSLPKLSATSPPLCFSVIFSNLLTFQHFDSCSSPQEDPPLPLLTDSRGCGVVLCKSTSYSRRRSLCVLCFGRCSKMSLPLPRLSVIVRERLSIGWSLRSALHRVRSFRRYNPYRNFGSQWLTRFRVAFSHSRKFWILI